MSVSSVNVSDEQLSAVASELGEALLLTRSRMVTAESCTGGWVGHVITSVAGSSRWYDRGFITYSNASKREMLGVSAGVIARYGAVSEQTARAMAEGALEYSQAQFALSITGIAGPGGGSDEKPVGLVWFAWAGKNLKTISQYSRFAGDRQAVQRQAVYHALQSMLSFVASSRA